MDELKDEMKKETDQIKKIRDVNAMKCLLREKCDYIVILCK